MPERPWQLPANQHQDWVSSTICLPFSCNTILFSQIFSYSSSLEYTTFQYGECLFSSRSSKITYFTTSADVSNSKCEDKVARCVPYQALFYCHNIFNFSNSILIKNVTLNVTKTRPALVCSVSAVFAFHFWNQAWFISAWPIVWRLPLERTPHW